MRQETVGKHVLHADRYIWFGGLRKDSHPIEDDRGKDDIH